MAARRRLRRRKLVFLAAVVSVGWLVFTWFSKPSLPVYQHKTVAAWFDEAVETGGLFRGDSQASALTAFSHFGAEAQPFLMGWAKRRTPLTAKIHDRWLIGLPGWVRQHLPGFHSQQWYLKRRQTALFALRFVEDWEQSRSAGRRYSGVDVGTNALPALVEALEDDDATCRFMAVLAIRKLGGRAWPAVQPLKQAVSDADLRVAISALQALGRMGESASNAVPFLVSLASDPTNRLRGIAVDTLAELGSAARLAVPGLIELVKQKLSHILIRPSNPFGVGGPSYQESVPSVASRVRMIGDQQAPFPSDPMAPAGVLTEAPSLSRTLSFAATVSVPFRSENTTEQFVDYDYPFPDKGATLSEAAPRTTRRTVAVTSLTRLSNGPVATDDRDIRVLAAEAMIKIGGVPSEYLASLEHLLALKEDIAQPALAIAVWRRDPENSALRRHVVEALNCKDSSQQLRALTLLTALGTNAAVFLPEVQRLTVDPDALVRMSATRCVKRLSPLPP